MSDDLFAELLEKIRLAFTYEEAKALADKAIVAFDQRVRMEDVLAHAFIVMLRQADNREFVRMARAADKDKPRWLKRYPLKELIREELDFRFLMARMPRIGEEKME